MLLVFGMIYDYGLELFCFCIFLGNFIAVYRKTVLRLEANFCGFAGFVCYLMARTAC